MRKIYYIMIAAVMSLMMFSSCAKEELVDISGEWYGTKMIAKEKLADIYLSFSEGSFVIYQKTGSQTRYYKYDGVYTLSSGILYGTYSDGTAMGASYQVQREGDSLLLTALNGSEETIVYVRTPIPDEVRNTAVPPVKSDNLN